MKPAMSNFVFDDTNIGVVFATNHVFDSTSDTRNLMLAKID
jgi:hypothetical protein